MACPAIPTCPLAVAEAERALPGLVTELRGELAGLGLAGGALAVRMTGCPNGCARPYTADLAFVGRSLGKYVGLRGRQPGRDAGWRSSTRTWCRFDGIAALVRPLFERFRDERLPGERFGDFWARTGLVPLASVTPGGGFRPARSSPHAPSPPRGRAGGSVMSIHLPDPAAPGPAYALLSSLHVANGARALEHAPAEHVLRWTVRTLPRRALRPGLRLRAGERGAHPPAGGDRRVAPRDLRGHAAPLSRRRWSTWSGCGRGTGWTCASTGRRWTCDGVRGAVRAAAVGARPGAVPAGHQGGAVPARRRRSWTGGSRGAGATSPARAAMLPVLRAASGSA